MFVLLVPPAAGDGLQGIKRGIMELADLVVVTKARHLPNKESSGSDTDSCADPQADGDLLPAAKTMARELRGALQMLRPRAPEWKPRVLMTSALGGDSVPKLIDVFDEYRDAMDATGALGGRREEQARI